MKSTVPAPTAISIASEGGDHRRTLCITTQRAGPGAPHPHPQGAAATPSSAAGAGCTKLPRFKLTKTSLGISTPAPNDQISALRGL